MKPDELLRHLDVQEWECAYCGTPIAPGTEVALAYDNNGVVHLSCASIGNAPERPA